MSTLLHHAPMEPSSLTPPAPPGMLRALGLALLAHALLIAALTWGVNWKQQESPAVEAEIWSSVRQQAAPRAVEPPPPPPAPAPAPPKAEPTPAPAPPKAAPPPPDTSVRDAQISLERDKKERERKEREQELVQQRKAAEKKRQEQQEAQAERAAQEKSDRAEKAAKDKAAREKADKAAREKAEKAEQAEKTERAEKAAREKSEKADKAAAEARRQDNIRRMQGLAGASGGATATGSALQSTGPSASYGAKVSARVRPNIVFADDVNGNPAAEVEVRAAPDGTIVGKRLVKSSGNKAWDDAVLRAIDKTETLPRDTDGRVPSLLVISFKPKD